MKRWFVYPTVAISAALALLAGPAHAAPPPPIVVTNTNASGSGSFTQAILDANASTGVKDMIIFNIPTTGADKDPGCDASGVCTLQKSQIWSITDPVVIDGYSQPGATEATESTPAQLKIVLPSFAADDIPVIEISYKGVGGTTLKGLVVGASGRIAIALDAGGNVIQGNYIGTDPTGQSLVGIEGMGGIGVEVASSGNTIGGSTPGARNVIAGVHEAAIEVYTSGPSPLSDNVIQGNYIGTDASGTTALGNQVGIWLSGATNNKVGPGNVISGSAEIGVSISDAGASSSGNVVFGNYIGTDKSGINPLPNKIGVYLKQDVSGREVTGNVIGGDTAADRNVISGNTEDGVKIEGVTAKNNTVKGNYIGTNKDGTGALGNDDGVEISEQGANNLVGGETPGARNVISGNKHGGVVIYRAGIHNVVKGNYIGTDKDGAVALGNTFTGVTVAETSQTTVGGTTPGARNVISGNGANGVSTGVDGVSYVQGNFIGTDKDGAKPIGNGGTGLDVGWSANTIGGSDPAAGNLIAYNLGPGVSLPHTVMNEFPIRNRILSNSIHSNGGLGIDLGGNGVTLNDPCDGDTGPNNLQNFPEIASAYASGASLIISGKLNSTPGKSFTVQFFDNSAADPSGYGEGEKYLGQTTVTTDGTTGDAPISLTLPVAVPGGHYLTATATDPDGNTSEFSKAVLVYVEPFPPTTSVKLEGTLGNNGWYTSEVKVTLIAEDNPGGSGVNKTEYSLDGGAWAAYIGPFTVSSDGVHTLKYRSTDNVGNVETDKTATIKIDKTKPTVAITFPTPGARVQDGVTFKAALTDATSGPASLSFSLREPNGTPEGKVIGTGEFENMAATRGSGDEWTLFFNTYIPPKLPDGPYVLVAEGFDMAGNSNQANVSFFIANWTTPALLPGKGNYNSGKTMPIKFSLRVSSLVDPTTPFIHNEQLTIKIYEKGKPTPILQTSVYGTGSTDYRIDDAAQLYIVNFQTGKTPTTYVVEVWRKTLKIDSFEFTTVK